MYFATQLGGETKKEGKERKKKDRERKREKKKERKKERRSHFLPALFLRLAVQLKFEHIS